MYRLSYSLISRSENYKNYEYPQKEGDIEYYVSRGFVANDASMKNDTFFNAGAYGKIGVGTSIKADGDWYKSLLDIVDFCNKNDIELVFFIAPEPEFTLVGKGNYQEYSEFISDIAEENGCAFYDFNLCRKDRFVSAF